MFGILLKKNDSEKMILIIKTVTDSTNLENDSEKS